MNQDWIACAPQPEFIRLISRRSTFWKTDEWQKAWHTTPHYPDRKTACTHTDIQNQDTKTADSNLPKTYEGLNKQNAEAKDHMLIIV